MTRYGEYIFKGPSWTKTVASLTSDNIATSVFSCLQGSAKIWFECTYRWSALEAWMFSCHHRSADITNEEQSDGCRSVKIEGFDRTRQTTKDDNIATNTALVLDYLEVMKNHTNLSTKDDRRLLHVA